MTDTPALRPEQVRQLLAECVTVVKPGEVLVLRCPENWGQEQAGEMQRWADYWLETNAPDIRALVVPHLGMTVVQPDSDEAFLARLEKAWPEMTRREMQRQASNYVPSR